MFPTQQDPEPPRKRRRVQEEDTDITMDVDPNPAVVVNLRSVILETSKESYLLSPSVGCTTTQYDIALILEDELEEESSILLEPATDPILPPIESNTESTKPTQEETNDQLPVSPVPPEPLAGDGIAEKTTEQATPATAPQTPDLEPSTTETVDGAPQSTAAPSPAASAASELAAQPLTSTSQPGSPKAEPSGLPSADPLPPIVVPELPLAPIVPEDILEDKPKQMLLQTLQRNLGEDMFRFTWEGVKVADGLGEEWVVQVKRWKWGPAKS